MDPPKGDIAHSWRSEFFIGRCIVRAMLYIQNNLRQLGKELTVAILRCVVRSLLKITARS